MKPVLVLTGVFFVSVIALKLINQTYDFSLAARIAMCAMLCFTAIGHVAFTTGMALMIPACIPFKNTLVYLTGIAEVLLGIGLLLADVRIYAAWALIVFFILLLPANIYAASKQINYEKGTFDGSGLSYLWFRVPLQIFFIAWTYISSIAF